MKFLIALILSSPLIAGIYWWDTGHPCYDFQIGFDVNYWKPCYDLLHVGEKGERQVMLNPDYQFGSRIFGRIDQKQGCAFLELEWDYLNGRTLTKGRGVRVFQFLENTQPTAPTTYIALQRIKYDSISLKYGYKLSDCFYTYIGARWVYIWVDRTLKTPFRLRSFSQYSAGGIEIGVGGNLELGCGWGIETRFGGIAIAGTRDHTFMRTPEKHIYSNALCTGGIEVRGGITYSYSCGGWWIARIELGYELTYYFSPLLGEQPTLSAKNVFSSDFALAGPYISVSLSF